MKSIFLPYEEAKAFVHTLKMKNCEEWNAYRKSGKRPRNIPANPYDFYRNTGWISWYDWLGKEKFLSYEKAKEFVHTLKLKGWIDWNAYSKSGERPRNIPSNPYKFYQHKGWINFCDWLGTPVETFLSYEEAKAFVHSLKLKGKIEWHGYCKSGKRPPNIPANPDKCYRNKAWLSWYDWLGTQQKSKKEIS